MITREPTYHELQVDLLLMDSPLRYAHLLDDNGQKSPYPEMRLECREGAAVLERSPRAGVAL